MHCTLPVFVVHFPSASVDRVLGTELMLTLHEAVPTVQPNTYQAALFLHSETGFFISL